MKICSLVFATLLCGCVSNAPFRTADGTCTGHAYGCGYFYEEHPGYDLGFVEFSERGNDFSPQNTAKILEIIKDKEEKGDIAIIVFSHGWKHNASTQDGNVKSFEKALDFIARSNAVGKKQIVGIYIGWRGLSLHGLQLENTTFWDRKAVAEEVGRGGVTELLGDLEYISSKKKSNFMLTIGHSFGAAITLSALHDTLLERMKLAEQGRGLRTFGDGVVLLNPAIEANQALLLKESSMRLGAKGEPLPPVMYVVSSRADIPTNMLFPIGRFLGMAGRWSQVDIERVYFERNYILNESQLDSQTIGNYALFRTGSMDDLLGDAETFEELASGVTAGHNRNIFMSSSILSLPNTKMKSWGFESYCSSTGGREVSRLPCFDHDPIDFISVPKSFIKNHNDIFNRNVIALLSTIVHRSLVQKDGRLLEYCAAGDKFDFGKCYAYYSAYNQSVEYLPD